MSYNIRVLKNGEAFHLPDFTNAPNVSFENSATGSLKCTYSKVGLNANLLVDGAVLEVRYANTQLYDSYFVVQDGEDPDEAAGTSFTIVARSLHDLFRRVVYINPAGPAKPLTASSITPGRLLIDLLTQAQARGALQGITWNFTATADNNGKPWAQTLWPEYEAGTKYDVIFNDLVEQGVITYRFYGNELQVFDGSDMGVDRIDGSALVEFIAGVDYEETPKKWSSKDRVKYSIAFGDNGAYDEEIGLAPLGPYGREEQSISHKGTESVGTLDIVNETSLKLSANQVREEITRKLKIQPGRPIAAVDYRAGDRIRERVGTLPSDPLRIMSMVIELPYNDSEGSVDLVLNDKLGDINTRMGRMLSKLSGGSTITGGGTSLPPVDLTTPSAPTGVNVSGNTFVDDATGLVKAVAHVNWTAPTTNTDGTLLTDLKGFETEIQTDGKATFSAPTTIAPARLDDTLRARFTRLNKPTNGWLAADNAANLRAADGKDWFFWADTIYGKADAKGKVVGGWQMPHSSITVTDPAIGNDLTAYVGSRNILSEAHARCESTGGWLSVGGTTAVNAWKRNGFGSLQMTRTGTGDMSASVSYPAGTLTNYRGMVQIDPSSTASVKQVRITFHNSSGTTLSTHTAVAAADGRASILTPLAPNGTVSMRLHVYSTAGAIGDTLRWTQAMIAPDAHELASWRLPVSSVAVKNYAPNPAARNTYQWGLRYLSPADLSFLTGQTTGLTGVTTAARATYNAGVGDPATSVGLTHVTNQHGEFAGNYVSVSARVRSSKSSVAVFVQWYDANWAYIGGDYGTPAINVTPNVWTTVTRIVPVPLPANATRVDVTAENVGAKVAGETFDMTGVVIQTRSGQPDPYFDGAMGGSIVWDGTADQSPSTWTRNNADHQDFGVASLFVSDDAGGPLYEYLWPADVFRVGDSAYLFLDGQQATPEGGSWGFTASGNVYLAQIDLVNKRLVRFERWSDQTIGWGTACRVDGSYAYIMGSARQANGSDNNYLMRVATADPWGARTYWNGSSWVATESSAVSIVNTAFAISSFRKVGNQWMALYCPFYARDLYAATASAVTGPWTTGTKVFKYPEESGNTGDKTFKYAARFVPQWDDNERGLAMLYAQNGDALQNILNYVPQFLRGPSGQAAGNLGTYWKDRQFTTDDPAIFDGLLPNQSVVARTRAVDNNGNTSEWSNATPILMPTDGDPPPRPSTPLVAPHFHGVRVTWDGLSDNGSVMPPDYFGFEIHVSDHDNFEPTFWTRVDYLSTRGGTASIQGLQAGKTYFVRIVVFDNTLNKSEPSEAVATSTEQLSDPDLPDKLIRGAKIADEAVSVRNLTVAAFDANLVRNGGFEEGTAGGLPTGWQTGYWQGTFRSENVKWTTDPAKVIGGSGSLSFTVPNTTDSLAALSSTIALTPGATYYLSVKMRADKTLAAGTMLLRLWNADDKSQILTAFRPGTHTSAIPGVAVPANEVVTMEGSVTVPATSKFGQVEVWAQVESAVGAYNVVVDDVEVRKIVGEAAIANASIGNAKIKDLAVDNAKIANMGVGKLTTGILTADITLSSRIKTSETGARVWIDATGIRAWDNDGNLKTSIPSNGGMNLLTGTVRTSLTGSYVEIGPGSSGGVIRLASGETEESAPGFISTWFEGDTGNATASQASLWLVSPKYGTNRTATFQLQSAKTSARQSSAGLWINRGDFHIMSDATSSGVWGGINFWNGALGSKTWLQIMRNGAGARVYAPEHVTLVSPKRSRLEAPTIEIIAAYGLITMNGTLQHGGGPVKFTDTWVRGISSAASVGIGSDGTLYHITSSKRYKLGIEDVEWDVEAVKSLRPRTFLDRREYVDNDNSPEGLSRHLGLIAEEVAEIPVLGDLVVPRDEEGRPNEVRYDRVALALIPWLQQLEKRVDDLQGMIAST